MTTEDFDIDSYLADTRPAKPDAAYVKELTDRPSAAKSTPKKSHSKKHDDFDIDAYLAEGAAPVADAAPVTAPDVHIDPKLGAVPNKRVYARFTDMPGEKFTAEQLGNINLDTSNNVPIALTGGALQGATGYFGDEAAAAVGALTGQGEYSKLRDDNRAANKYAQSLSPQDYTIGELAGGAASPLNKLIPGSGGKPLLSLRNTAVAGGTGGVSALGASNADLTKGEFGDGMKDVAIGTGVGIGANAVLGGVGKLGKAIGSMPERVAKKADDVLIDRLSLGAPASERDALVGELGKDKQKVLGFVRQTPGLENAVLTNDQVKAAEIVRQQKALREKAGAETVKELEERWGPQEAQRAVDALEKLQTKYAKNPSPESQKMAADFQRRIDAIKERWIPEPPKPEPKGKELVAALSEGASASEKQRIGDNSALYEQVATKYKLGKSANDPESRFSAIDGAVKQLGDRKETLYGKVKEPVLITDVTLPLVKWRDELAQSSEGLKAVPAVDSMIGRIWQSRGKGGKQLTMTVQDLRQEVSDMQKAGFSGPYFDPSVAQDLQRQAAGVMKDALDKHISKHGGEKVAKGIAELNKEYSALLTMRDVAERQRAAARLVPPSPPDTRTGQASVGELFDLANKTENPEAKAAIMSSLTKQMDKDAADKLASINADRALIEQVEAPIVSLGTRNATPPTTGRAGLKKVAERVGGAGIGGALVAGAMGQHAVGGIMAATAMALKYGPVLAEKAEPAMAQMVIAARKGAKKAHLEQIGKLNKLPKYVIDDMVGTLIPRTTAGEVVGRIEREPDDTSDEGTPAVPAYGQTIAQGGTP